MTVEVFNVQKFIKYLWLFRKYLLNLPHKQVLKMYRRNIWMIMYTEMIERFSYDLEIKTREQYRNNKQTEIERFNWFIEHIQTRVAFGWLSGHSSEKTSMPENFLETNPYFALTSYCNTIGQSNNAFSILGFSLVGKLRGHVLIFSSIGW